MELVEDLGRCKPTSTSNYYKTYGMYKCKCGVIFRVAHSAVKSNRISQCKTCGRNSVPSYCKINYISILHTIHNCKYDYSKVVFTTTRDIITIVCPIHGDFHIPVKNHRAGNGCHKCGEESRSIILRGKSKVRPATLYYVYFENINLWKIGVTTKISSRFNGETTKPQIIYTEEFSTELEAYYVEDALKSIYSNIFYSGYKLLKRKGNTELLIADIPFKRSVETIKNTNEFKNLLV